MSKTPLPPAESIRLEGLAELARGGLGEADPLLGSIVGGRFKLIGVLGEGGMGRVYVAEQKLGTQTRKVAVKTLLAEYARDTKVIERFMRECAAVVELEHPSTIKVYDYGKTDADDLYVAMELLTGVSLEEALKAAGALAPDRVDRILSQICGSLQEAHDKGIGHLDLKPANIYLTTRAGEEDYVKVLDFDFGKRDDQPSAKEAVKLTRAGAVLGTPPYMSPEELTGRALDARSDVYSLGVITYEMLTGRLPFDADTPLAWAVQHVTAQPLPFETAPFGNAVPFKMKAAVMRALSKDKAQRQQSVREFFEELTGGLQPEVFGPPHTARGGFALPSPPDPDLLVPFRHAGAFAGDFGPPLPPPLIAPAQGGFGPPPPPPAFGAPPGFGPPQGFGPPPPRPAPMGAIAGAPPPRSAPVPAPIPEARSEPRRLDENVQFTVYRPKVVQPETWAPFLAFAHLAERRPDAPPGEPDPVAEVARQAAQVLGAQVGEFQSTTQDSRQAIPAEGEITFVPEADGITFNPRRRTFSWEESVQREEFRLRASRALDGRVARGRLTVFLGSILVADVHFAIRVDSAHASAGEPSERDQARPYRRIFASYSHKDTATVEQFERYVETLGDQYLRDSVSLRSGEVWSDALTRLIDEADVFQLFWSRNSMRSPYVRKEWEYALSLHRPSFVRPTYWEDPLPALPEEGLPPEALVRLHFHHLGDEPDDTPPPPETFRALPVPPAQAAYAPPAMLDAGPRKSAPAWGSALVIAVLILPLIALAAYLLRSC